MFPTVVDTAWLNDHLLAGDLALVDVRPPPFYQQEHIPGAVNLPVFLLSGQHGGLPAPDDLARHLGNAGMTRETPIVAYDDGASPAAALLYWVLDAYGHPHVSILDGGITKWRHEGRDVEYTRNRPAPARYEIGQVRAVVSADLDGVKRAEQTRDATLLDVRSPAEYLGLQATAHRNGHIPGSVNVEWSNNLRRGDGLVMELRDDGDLRGLYEEAGVTPNKPVIVYCQSGARCSETYLVLKKLGYPDVRVYAPGWQEWGNRLDTDVEIE